MDDRVGSLPLVQRLYVPKIRGSSEVSTGGMSLPRGEKLGS